MAKKKPPTETLRIPAKLAQKARAVASALGMSLPKYVEEVLRPAVERDLPRAIKILQDKKHEGDE